MSPKERNPFKNARNLDDLFEGLIRTAFSGGDPPTPQGEIRFCASGSCADQAGSSMLRPIEPILPSKPEPLIDINRDEKVGELRITAEMPGFTKEAIKVEEADGSLKIEAEKDGGRYQKEIPLEAEIDTGKSKVTYRNGVLEATLKVREFKKAGGKGLKVE